jgi:hypothetical protein
LRIGLLRLLRMISLFNPINLSVIPSSSPQSSSQPSQHPI